jgi:hypothetical protein
MPKTIKIKGSGMKKIFFAAVAAMVFSLAACQMNHIHDTGGGAIAPSSIVKLSGGSLSKP